MPPSEKRRLKLYETLIDSVGDEAAATLMECLPPGGWENVATKEDLKLLEERLTVKIAGLDGKIAALDGKIAALDGKIDNGLDSVRGEIAALDGKIARLDDKIDNGLVGLRGEFEHALARQTRTMVFTMLGIAITIWLALLLPFGAG